MRLFIVIFLIYLFNLTAQESLPLQELAFLKEELAFFSQRQEPSKKEEEIEVSLNQFNSSLSADCESLAIVAGCVNVISGSFFQRETDLQGTTIDPLHFIRNYDSSCIAQSFLGLGFGSSFPLWASQIQEGARHSYGVICERENSLLLYRNREKGPANVYYLDPRIFEKGYTNFSQMSGQHNLMNWKAIFRTSEGVSEWRVALGDGTRRLYRGPIELDKGFRSKILFPTRSAYLLKEEVKPNGNVLLFDYTKERGDIYLKSIKTLNRTRSHVLNKLTFDHQEEMWRVEDGCGNAATFYQEEKIRPYTTELGVRFLQKNILRKASSSQQKESTSYLMRPFHLEVEEIQKPAGQCLKIKYNSQGKVKALLGPQDGKEDVLLYQFFYQKDHTTVFDAIGQKTSYFFDDHKRISSIVYYDVSGGVYRQESFYWNQMGWLVAKAIGRGNGKVCVLRTYLYDERGNVKKETLYGNLTGDKPFFFFVEDKGEMDHLSIAYTYSEDGFNLVTEKRIEKGAHFSYEYLKGTHLCTKELCSYDGRVQERTFYTFDENGELQMIIKDNGSGQEADDLSDVTVRKIKTIESVKEKGAAFGKPQIIKEFYQEGQIVKFLKETTLSYDARGLERAREVKDSNGKSFVSYQTFNAYLQLEEKKDPLGQIMRYAFDANGNQVYEELLGSFKKSFYTFDFANRLKKKEEFFHDELFTTHYEYNALNELIQETDPYGQKRNYLFLTAKREIISMIAWAIKPSSPCQAFKHKREKSFIQGSPKNITS